MKIKDSSRSNKVAGIISIVALVLQIALAPQIEICGGRINFTLALAVLYALSGDTHRATVAGFLCGLAYDLTAAVPVGLMALLLTITGFFGSSFFHGVQISLNTAAVRCAAIMIFAVNVVYGILLFFMGVQTDFFWAVFGHGVSTSVLTLLIALVFLFISSTTTPQTTFTARSKGTRYKSLR